MSEEKKGNKICLNMKSKLQIGLDLLYARISVPVSMLNLVQIIFVKPLKANCDNMALRLCNARPMKAVTVTICELSP